MRLASHFHATERRSIFLLLVALFLLSSAIIGRLLTAGTLSNHSLAIEPPPAPVELSHDNVIARLQATLRHNPENIYAYAQLGLALLQKARETADPSLYLLAETAFTEALNRDAQQLDALIGQGILALSRHDFIAALQWAERARTVNPYRAESLGIMVDAQIELGRYDEAVATGQSMVNMRPDLSSYSRVSYLRELHGDTAGAITAMQAAVDAGVPGTEAMLWAQVQLGHLYFNSGDLQKAEAAYRQALWLRPDYAHATAGLARVQAARGDERAAIEAYEALVQRLPLPHFVITLGELYEATGRLAEAQRQYDLVRAMQQLNADAGVTVDLEMALFAADHAADPTEALELAHSAYAARPSIYAADGLAWALYRQGHFSEAQRYSQEALRLNTRDATLYYHAGMIYAALGERQQARQMLVTALDINPYFNPLQALVAQETLAQLPVESE
jgi:tetratricopeptide (TPR) repeat protein